MIGGVASTIGSGFTNAAGMELSSVMQLVLTGTGTAAPAWIVSTAVSLVSGLARVGAGVASPWSGPARAVLMGTETAGTRSLGVPVAGVRAQGATSSFDVVTAGLGSA